MSWLRNDLKKTKTHLVVRVTERLECLVSLESDADVVPEKRRRRGAYHKARIPRNNNPSASIQVGPALQSELKKLQQLASRGSRAPKVEWDKVCKVAHEAISLLQPGSKTSDVAATFTSQATGKRGQHVVDIFAMLRE